MNRLIILVMLSLSTTIAKAQQDLRDPSYIYHLEDKNNKGSVEMVSYGHVLMTAVSFNGKLYKDVDFFKFYKDYELIKYQGKHTRKLKKISKHTNDPEVTRLYVVGKPLTVRQLSKRMDFISTLNK